MARQKATPYVIRICQRSDDRQMEEIPFETAEQLCDYLRKRHVANDRYFQLADMDLSGQNLDSAKLYGAQFSRVNLSGASLKYTHLMGARMTDVDFTDAELNDAVAVDAKFTDCNFAKAAIFRGNFASVTLDNCSLADIQANRLVLDKSHIRECDFTGAVFASANMWFAEISDSDFTRAHFSYSQLTNAEITDTDFSKAEMPGCNLMDAIVTRSKFNGANLSDISVHRASFMLTRLQAAARLSMKGTPRTMSAYSPAQMQRLRRRALVAGACP